VYQEKPRIHVGSVSAAVYRDLNVRHAERYRHAGWKS
jgi:hypothetical protein